LLTREEFMKKTTTPTALLILFMIATTTPLISSQESASTFNNPICATDVEEKHASFHVEEITITNDNDNNYDDCDREKTMAPQTNSQTIEISDENETDDFLDVIADDVSTETPHVPRHNPSPTEKVVIALKIAKNISSDFFYNNIEPVLVAFWNAAKRALPH